MLSRRKFLQIAGGGAATFALAACGSDDTSNDADAEEAEEAEEEASEETSEPVEVRVAALKGPTAMGLVQFMSEVDDGTIDDNDYAFDIYASSDEVTPLISQDEVDIAALPANLASVLYNNTDGGVQAIAVNTLGVLYICEQGDTVQTVADLAGKTIYASGKGSTPEYALEYVLGGNGLTVGEDVQVEWASEHSEALAQLLNDPDGVAMLPQPFVTTAQMQNDSIRVALDLTEEWDALQTGDETSSLITGVAIVRTAFAEEHPEVVDTFLEHYAESVEFVNGNVEEAAELVGSYDIVTAEVAEVALPECNIVCITGDDMKEQLSGYLEVLAGQNSEAVGGTVPDDDFYYGA